MMKGIKNKLIEYDKVQKDAVVLERLIVQYFRPKVIRATKNKDWNRLEIILDNAPKNLHEQIINIK